VADAEYAAVSRGRNGKFETMASQHSHRKLVDIASDVTQTGILDLPRLIDRQTGH
jgi:hypothetical protein